MNLTVIVKHHGFKSIAPHVGPNDPWSLVCSSSSCSTPLVIMIPLLLNNKLKNVWHLLEVGNQHLWNLTDLSSLVLLFHVPLFFLELLRQAAATCWFQWQAGNFHWLSSSKTRQVSCCEVNIVTSNSGAMDTWKRIDQRNSWPFSLYNFHKKPLVSLAPGVSASWFHHVLQLLP